MHYSTTENIQEHFKRTQKLENRLNLVVISVSQMRFHMQEVQQAEMSPNDISDYKT